MRARRWKSREVFDIFYNRAKRLNVSNLILGCQLEVQSEGI